MSIVLARLLLPHDFGVVTLAAAVIGSASLLLDLGLGGMFVLHQELDDRAAGTVLTLITLMSGLGTVLVWAAAPLVARLFSEHDVLATQRALAATVALGGLSWFLEISLQRALLFRRLFLAKSIQTITQGFVSVALATAGWGLTSIVVGILAGSLAYAVSLLLVSPNRVRPSMNWALARELLAASRGFFAQGTLHFLEYNIDNFAVARALGAASLGFYSMAYRLADQTYWAVTDPVGRVAFPAFARMRQRNEDVRTSFLMCLRFVALLACPIALTLSAVAQPLIAVAFGKQWLPMTQALTILGLWAAIRALHSTMAWFLSSMGHASIVAKASITLFGVEAPSLVVAAAIRGINAVALVMLLHAILTALTLTAIIARKVQIQARLVARTLRPILLASGAGWLAARAASSALEPNTPAFALAVSTCAGLACFGVIAHLLEPNNFRSVVRWVRGVADSEEESDSLQRVPEWTNSPHIDGR